MKTSILTVGFALLLIALSFALVRLDLAPADLLRFLPALLGMVVAVVIIVSVWRRSRK